MVNQVQARPGIVGNCHLFLDWPDPECTYDIEALQLLNPVSIFTTTGDWKGNQIDASSKEFYEELIRPARCGKEIVPVLTSMLTLCKHADRHGTHPEYTLGRHCLLLPQRERAYTLPLAINWFFRKEFAGLKDIPPGLALQGVRAQYHLNWLTRDALSQTKKGRHGGLEIDV